MSSSDAFYNQFGKLAKEWGYKSLGDLAEDFIKPGDGFRERFERICGILLIKTPNETSERRKQLLLYGKTENSD